MAKMIVVFSMVAFVVGCSSHHLGYTESEWEAFSIQERHDIQQEYRQVLNERNTMLFGDPIQEVSEKWVHGDQIIDHKLGY